MVGVCIKYFHENYGGMLQALATVKMLEQRGIDYELIQYKKQLTTIEKIKSIPRLFNAILINDKFETFLKNQGMKRHPEIAENDVIRMKAFEQFRKEMFTKLSPEFCGYKALCAGAKRYNAVITGSDQLWSPAGLPTNYYNLMFVPDEVRKISFASSFGVSQIPWYQKRRTKHFLNRIDYISMRENRGSEIVKELTGRDVPTILDPVFCFTMDGWEKIIPTKREVEEPYIFAYFLGNFSEYREAVRRAAKKLNCRIVALRHLDQYVEDDEQFGDMAPYDVAPDKFLNLLRGAEYVCTDSFHGSCFSIIHRKQFVIFNRYVDGTRISKNSRIDTLCENLGLQDRRYNGTVELAEHLKSCIDYQSVDARLLKIKRDTDIYINTALEGI